MLLGSVVSTILVIVVTAQVSLLTLPLKKPRSQRLISTWYFQIALDTSYWTIFNHITVWGSLLFYFVLDYSYNYTIQGAYVGTLTMAMNEAMFWFTTVITVTILTIPVLAWRFYFADIKPSLSDRVRLKQRLAALKFRWLLFLWTNLSNMFYDFASLSDDPGFPPPPPYPRSAVRSLILAPFFESLPQRGL